MEPFFITRTNTKRYVGRCGLCDFTTNVISVRAQCALRLRGHCVDVHGVHPTSLNQYLEPPRKARHMKQPGKELPPMEKLSDYEGHLMVFGSVAVGRKTSSYGTSVADCLVWVYVKGSWKALGETPIFWPIVGNELLREIGPDTDAKEETLGAFLRLGGHPEQRKGGNDFYWLEPVSDTQSLDLLKEWEANFSDDF